LICLVSISSFRSYLNCYFSFHDQNETRQDRRKREVLTPKYVQEEAGVASADPRTNEGEAPPVMVVGKTERSAGEGFADNHDWTKEKVLDFNRGYLNYGQDGKPEFPPNTSIKFEQEEDGQTLISIEAPDDKGIDQDAAAFL